MNYIDLTVLFGTLLFIVVYGVWKTRGQKDMDSYLRGSSLKWSTIGLSVMATQASAITFISTPGQGYESGMGFVQNYFGQPFAMIIVMTVFIPIYYRLKVYTAYEYLESRFDLKTRALGALLFLVQRGLAAGITIYAPAIVLSSILDWNLDFTILITGLLVIIYTVSGGTKAVSITQKQQMAVIMAGMFFAFFMLISYIGDHVSFFDAFNIANALNKTQAVDFDFNFEKRYTFWSGMTGGLFLALSYFGTDQSQVQRYLGGKDVRASKMGLMFNAILKVPMMFFILFVGVILYVFYIFYTPPVHFKEQSLNMLESNGKGTELAELREDYRNLVDERKQAAYDYVESGNSEELVRTDTESREVREKTKALIAEVDAEVTTKDSDYVFLTFILNYLPHGFIGLLIAVILSAAMSSTSGEISALASTTAVDFYKRFFKAEASGEHYLMASKAITLLWGGLAILFAFIAKSSENLIEAVNIVGSIFYGTILGIFLVAFFFKYIKGTAVFYAALLAQGVVITFHFLTVAGVLTFSYLMYNVVGCLLTILFGFMIQLLQKEKMAPEA